MGGLSRLQNIRDLTRAVEMVQLSTEAKATETIQILIPDSIRLATKSDLGETLSFCDGKSGWSWTEYGMDDSIAAWQIKAAQQDVFRQLEFLVQSDRDPERTVEFVERANVEGKAADVLQISSSVGAVRLWIDAISGDVVELEYPRIVPSGQGALVIDFYHDYRRVEKGLRIPFKVHTLTDGQPYMDTTVKHVEYNNGLRLEALSRKDVPKSRNEK